MKTVDQFIWDLKPSEIVAFGTSAVAKHAIETGENIGAETRTEELAAGRDALILASRKSDVRLAVFVANDAETKKPSEGIAGIMATLNRANVPFQWIDSPCTAKTCEAATHLMVEVDKLNDSLTTAWRRTAIVKRLIARGLVCHDLKQRLEERLETAYTDAETSPERFAAWLTYLASHEALDDALRLALNVLTPIEAVSIRRGAVAA